MTHAMSEVYNVETAARRRPQVHLADALEQRRSRALGDA